MAWRDFFYAFLYAKPTNLSLQEGILPTVFVEYEKIESYQV
jgi:hypothetical protein